MNKFILVFIVTFSLVFNYSCSKDNDDDSSNNSSSISGHFTHSQSTYNLDNAVISNFYGVEAPIWIQLEVGGGGAALDPSLQTIVGTGNGLEISFYTDDTTGIPSGVYDFKTLASLNECDDAVFYLNHNFLTGGGSFLIVESGNVTVQRDGEHYNFNFNFITNTGETVTGDLSGNIPFYLYE